MMTRIVTLIVCAVLFFQTLAFAHGGKKHLMGTVTTVDAQHIVVQTKDGKTLSIGLKKETQYRKGSAAATAAAADDLKVGDRVVVDVTGKGDEMTASEIRFSSPGDGKGREGMPHHQM